MRQHPFLFLTESENNQIELHQFHFSEIALAILFQSNLSTRIFDRSVTEVERSGGARVKHAPVRFNVLSSDGMDLTFLRSGVGGPAPDNLVLVLVFAFGSFLARLLLDRLVYKPCSMKLLKFKAVPMVNDEANWTKIAKSCESMWKLTYYTTVQIWVISIIKQEPWSLNTKEYFKGWPNQEMKSSLMLFYMCQCGFYTYSIVALFAWEIRRKDFLVMMSHHIITSILIGFSYITRFFRIGMIILALHDTSDVFLESAKLFKYSGMEMAASLFFGLFAMSWFLLRLIYFPLWIIKSSSYESFKFLSWMNQFPTILYYTFNTMLITLLIFHAYWGKLIFVMIMKQMSNRGQVGEDIRSDSEDEG